MKRLLTLSLLLVLAVATVAAADKEKTDPRASLAPFNDYIGSWQGDGKEVKKKASWAETLEWGWKFKGEDAWLVMKAKDGKFLKTGEMRYLNDKKEFQFTGTDTNDKKIVLQGKIDDKGYLTLLGADDNKEQLKLVMFIAGDGVFFNYRYSRAREGAKLFVTEYEMKAEKDGEVIKRGSNQPVCVVSGGLGTMQVSHKGVTYYVCCSGCRDAFAENPEKWIKEFNAKKK